MKSLILLPLLFVGAVHAIPIAPLSAPPSSLKQNISFEETYSRYPSPFGIIQAIKHIYPRLKYPNNYECLYINGTSAPVSGAIDPLQGAALEETPGPLFYSYFEKCVREQAGNAFYYEEEALGNTKEIFGEERSKEIIEKLEKLCKGQTGSSAPIVCQHSSGKILGFWTYQIWNLMPQIEREAYMLDFVRYLAGPDTVLRHLKLIGPESVFGPEVKDTTALVKFLDRELSKVQQNGNIGLQFYQIYSETAIVLRLGPALKD